MDVIEELKAVRGRDIPYSRVLSSMCTVPHPVAAEAHSLFIETNLGDPGIFVGTMELEKKVISMLGRLLGNKNAAGYISSGGTEANIQGIRAARNLKKVDKPNIVIPKSAHFSFEKIGDILGVEIRRAKLDENYCVDVSEVEKLVDDNTVALVGIAGTTELGQVDDIKELGKIAEDQNVFLHIDAAFGGLVLPFLDEKVPFDFEVRAVSSITVDPHKMGMATIPAGGILFRDETFLKALEVETPYLTTRFQYTLTGTRPGTGVASTYAVLKHLGYDGMKGIVRECLRNTRTLVEEMKTLGFEPVVEPVMNVVSFHARDASRLKDELYRRRWVISTIREPEAIRMVIMPHVNEEMIKEFISDFRQMLIRLGYLS
ncbi:tyrosine decarboxylase MfnA [Geoglobus acetivorans]|uniref:Probable L-aspartate decarboxylase n=1 Tax=Geoglobus acetivorans TaxID=565033 RepID=A0ABZ3H3X2_GEOAI|nr:tyrosine decarboxylase MfnA [Geoglobus acetivorans]